MLEGRSGLQPSGLGLVDGRGPTNPCVAEVGEVFLTMILSDSEKIIFGSKKFSL